MYDNECGTFRILYASNSDGVAADTNKERPLFFEKKREGIEQFPKTSFIAKTAGKNRTSEAMGEKSSKGFYYLAPVSYFKRYSCMHKQSPTKENHSQHKGDSNISHHCKLPPPSSHPPFPSLFPYKIMVCPQVKLHRVAHIENFI